VGRFLRNEGSILTVPVIHNDSPICMGYKEESLGRGYPVNSCAPRIRDTALRYPIKALKGIDRRSDRIEGRFCDVPVCSAYSICSILDLIMAKFEGRMGICQGKVNAPNQTMSPVLNPIITSILSGEAVAGLTS
jgi:hypothetical protein